MEAINKLIRGETGDLNLIGKFVVIIIYFAIAYGIVHIINYSINRTLKSKIVSGTSIDQKRFKTASTLLKSASGTFIYIIWFFAALGVFNIHARALLTTAGIGGIAIGLAARSFIEDIIGGLFLILENQYNVGDYVELANKSGIVQEVTLRRTTIKDFSGEIHFIPNGIIKIVTNKSKNLQRALVRYEISYESDIEKAKTVLMDSIKTLAKNEEVFVDGPVLFGVTALNSSSVEISIATYTIPGEQWRIENLMREKGKERLDAEGIEIPYNKLDVNVKGESNA